MISIKREKPLPLGLQFGPNSVTVAQLRNRGGELNLSAFAQSTFSSTNDESEDESDKQKAELIRHLVRQSNFKGRRAVCCLGMEDLFVQNVRLPKLSKEETEKVIYWEAAERLPYPIEEAEIRHWLAAEVRQGDDSKQELILMSCKKSVIERRVRLMENAGLIPTGIDVEPCAILRGLSPLTKDSETSRRICMNLGERATTVIIESGDHIQFLKNIDGGGEHLNQAIADQLQLGLAEAAELRARVTNAKSLDADDEVHRCVIDAIRDPLEAISDEMERCLRYYKVTFREQLPEEIIITGAEAALWLIDFISERLGIPCKLGNPMEQLECKSSVSPIPEKPWQWITALGLSLKQEMATENS